MKSIALIIPYFGKWPPWFNLFLETCKTNTSVDWLFFTDCMKPENYPVSNVHYIDMSIEGFNELASKTLGMNLNITRPYKICDLRPAFGVIFQQYLDDYDFWGWSDVDVLLGDIRHFMTEEVLEKYDVVSSRMEFIAGEFTLFRNAEYINSIYKTSKDYERVFNDTVGYDFDEIGVFHERVVESITHVVDKLERDGKLKALLRTVIQTDRKLKGSSFSFYWNKGQLVNVETGEEMMLYHFLDLKGDEQFKVPEQFQSRNGFVITENGIELTDFVVEVKKHNSIQQTVAQFLNWVRWRRANIRRRKRLSQLYS